MSLQKFFNIIGNVAAILLAVCLVAIFALAAAYLVKLLVVAVFS